MRTYATVRGTFWVRGSGKKLRGNPEAQVLAMYLMTCCQGTLCGLFSIALPTIAHETGLRLERIPELLADISEIAKYDPEEELCWVPNAAREQIGEKLAAKDKRRAGLLRELKQFEGHKFHQEFTDLYGEAYALEGHTRPSEGAVGDELCPLEAPSKGHPASAATPGLGQGLGLDQVRGVQGGDGPEGDARVPCPPDLALSEAQATNREMAGCPRWAQEAITRSFVGRYLADPDDRRTLATWRKCLDVAIGTTWSDPNKRPQRPAESSPDAAAAARRAAEQRREESRRRAREALLVAHATLGAPPPQRRVTGAATAEQSPSSKVTDAREVES